MNQKYVIGSTIENVKAIAWFNSIFDHSMPLSLNTLNRAILKSMTGDHNDISVSIKPYFLRHENKTIAETRSEMKLRSQNNLSVGMKVVFFLLLSYLPGIFIAFYIKERECKAKLLQYISGINEIIYWLTSLLFDYTVYMTIMSLILIKIWMYQKKQLDTFELLSQYLVVFGFYGYAILPFVYLFSYSFKKHVTGVNMTTVSLLVRKFLITNGKV